MARPKQLVLSMSVDRAARRHSCQHNSNHTIYKGDLRLKVAVGRSYDHYCSECARKFIQDGIHRLQELSAEMDGVTPK